jgi:hypothetical protein
MTSDYDSLPTLKQILRQADSIGDEPMSDEAAAAWFEETVRENREAGQRDSRSDNKC